MTAAVYDTGALIAAERGDRDLWAFHRGLLANGLRPLLSTAVLAQAWRGGPQPLLSRLLGGCDVEPLTTARARLAGEALAASGGSDVVDAAVAVTARARGRVIVTSDPADLARICQAIGFDPVLKVV